MRRAKKGQSLIEFVMATTVVIPVALLGIDSFLILYGMQLNEAICREAARSASSGDPRVALLRACQVVSKASARGQGTFILTLVGAATSVRKSQLDALAPYGGQVSGVVDITTAVDVKPVVLSLFLGKQKCLRIEATEEVPCTYVLPNVLERSIQTQNPTAATVANYNLTQVSNP